MFYVLCCFFFFKQKTAYEMRISDWSSDVCSSDLKGKVKLITRGGLDWTGRFGKAIAQALAALPVKEAVIDGELVVENDAGASDFSALQPELSAGRASRFVFYAFDLLHLAGHDLQGVHLQIGSAHV